MRDERFLRGNIPMTKSEVRAVSLAKLEIRPDDVIYDIGAGTGSVTAEAALLAPKGRVYAFERNEEGCALIRANAERLGAGNVTVIPGVFPDSLTEKLPAPDCVFIGGSGGRLTEILELLLRRFPACRVVLNVIALETLSGLTAFLKREGLEAEVVLLQASRAKKAGAYHLMEAQNPVYIVTILREDGR